MNNTKYPTHEEVGKTIREFTDACLDYECMHNRESLDMLIADLKQYRETIATCREYMDHNLL